MYDLYDFCFRAMTTMWVLLPGTRPTPCACLSTLHAEWPPRPTTGRNRTWYWTGKGCYISSSSHLMLVRKFSLTPGSCDFYFPLKTDSYSEIWSYCSSIWAYFPSHPAHLMKFSFTPSPCEEFVLTFFCLIWQSSSYNCTSVLDVVLHGIFHNCQSNFDQMLGCVFEYLRMFYLIWPLQP